MVDPLEGQVKVAHRTLMGTTVLGRMQPDDQRCHGLGGHRDRGAPELEPQRPLRQSLPDQGRVAGQQHHSVMELDHEREQPGSHPVRSVVRPFAVTHGV